MFKFYCVECTKWYAQAYCAECQKDLDEGNSIAYGSAPSDRDLGLLKPAPCNGSMHAPIEFVSKRLFDSLNKEINELQDRLDFMKDLSLAIHDGLMLRRQALHWRAEARRLALRLKELEASRGT
jgi:hypothetical protein